MKNLSFLISLVAIAVLVACSNKRNNQKLDHETMGGEIRSVNTESVMDTTNGKQGSDLTGTSGTKKDSLNKEEKYSKKSKKEAKEASKNEAPNQAEIDSLKKVTEKEKKP
jgi:hypothetical protein